GQTAYRVREAKDKTRKPSAVLVSQMADEQGGDGGGEEAASEQVGDDNLGEVLFVFVEGIHIGALPCVMSPSAHPSAPAVAKARASHLKPVRGHD
ncbi:aar2 domain containing protein, partial [Lasius niger]